MMRLNDQESELQFSTATADSSPEEEIALRMSYQKIQVLYDENSRLIGERSVPEDRFSLYYSYLKQNGRVLEVVQKMIESALTKLRQNSLDFLSTIRSNYNQIN